MKTNKTKFKVKSRKLKTITFSFYFLVSTFYSFAQDSIHISGQLLNNTKFAKVVVQKFGVGVFDIAATGVDKETGKFRITAPSDVEQGIYRLRYSQTGFAEFVDVIINGKEKEITFTLDVSKEPEQRIPVFIASEENKAWYAYLQKSNNLVFKIQVNQDFLNNYPDKSDKAYKNIYKEFEKAKQTFLQQRQTFIKTTSFYWAKNKALYSNIFFPNLNEHPRLQQFNAQNLFWLDKPTTNPLLINTPLYTDAILAYMQYYMDPKMEFGEEEQTQGFIKSIDTIISRFSANKKTHEFALKYLQMGFKEIANEKALQYIDQAYKEILLQCQDDSNKDDFEQRLIAYEALKPGVIAPEIKFKDANGTLTTLKDFKQNEVVVAFWASWCPHCMEEIPKLQEWAKNNPETQVLAISLDDNYNTFQEAIKSFPDLIHYCDLQKWQSEIVKDYHIMATPTLIQLDKERKIINKYSNFSSFLNSQTSKK